MKTTIRQVPSDLPHAELYIDDLVEIEDVLRKVISEQNDVSWERFEYEIDDELRMTTHEELAEHRGNASNFRLIAVYSIYKQIQRTEVLRFYRSLEPQLSAYWGSVEDRWATYAQIAQIFEPRKLRFKNLLNRSPFFAFAILGPLMGYAVLMLVGAGVRHGIPRGFASYGEIGAAVVILAAVVALFSGFFVNSKVLFRYSRLDLHERMRARKELMEKILLVVVGAIFGCLSTIAASYFKRGQ